MNTSRTLLSSISVFLVLGLTSVAARAQQPESPVSCDEGNEPLSLAYGDHTTGCAIEPVTDLDRFEFCGVTGDLVRINVLSASNLLDPNVEVRDPAAAIVATGGCTDSCSDTIDLTLATDGCHTVFVSDTGVNDPGAYSLQIERIVPGPDAAVHVNYDEALSDTIDPGTDIDAFTFNGTVATNIRLNVLAASNLLDPTVEIRDPNGMLVLNGSIDGASCNDSCAFSIDLEPAVSGTYSMLIYDLATNEIGGYEMSIWCLSGPCDSDANGTPDPKGALVSYVTPRTDAIDPGVDSDSYTFNGTAGTELRLAVLAAGNLLDPTVEIRDPSGALIVNGVADGATCNDSCSFSVDLSPATSGIFTLIIYDRTTNETGDYGIGLWCLSGPCDSDADGLVDGNPRVSFATPAVLQYGIAAVDEIEPAVENDILIFGGTAGDLIRINVAALGNLMDPTVEIRDPDGTVIVNGVADGASCNDSCSYSLDLTPSITGVYSLLVYDRTTNEPGGYEISVQCLIGTCADAAVTCGDNCIDFANGPTITDAGGNIQLDTDMDGYGNGCDTDLNNDGVSNPQDLGLFRDVFFSNDPDADFNGDGDVNPQDLGLMRALFFNDPGPACTNP